ncbi:hypothetical protein Tco_0885775 [Tanacetum coccineum]
MDVDDEISNLVDLHMDMFDDGWKWQDLQGLLWLNHHKRGFGIAGIIGQTKDVYSGTMAGVDINTLTMEQYLALSRENQAPSMVKPEIEGNVNFEIKSQFMREFREDTFSGNKNEDAHDHVDRVFNIVSLFNIPRVSQDAVLLCVFPFTHSGSAKRWVDGLTPGAVNTWDLLKIAFIQSGTRGHQADVSSNSNTDGLAAIVSKLDNLGHNMKMYKENVHTIQVGCQICEGPHLDKEYPLNEEVKQLEEVKFREFGRSAPFNESNRAKFRVGPSGYYTHTDTRPPYGEKKPSLEELMSKHQEESARRSAKMKEWFKKLQENAKINTRNQSASLKNLETQIEQLANELQSRTTNRAPSSSTRQCKVVNANHETPNIPISSSKLNNLRGVSFLYDSSSHVTQNNEESTIVVP